MTTDAQYYRLALRIFADLSGAIAIPAVLAALLGKWLDGRYHTEPRYLIILLILAFAITIVSLRRKTKYYGQEFDKLNKKS